MKTRIQIFKIKKQGVNNVVFFVIIKEYIKSKSKSFSEIKQVIFMDDLETNLF